MSKSVLFFSLCVLLLQPACGVVAGTVIDTSLGIATYPVREYVFFGAYKYDNTWTEPYKKIEVKKDPEELLLGVCISGGGSRSAYYMACVLEELSRIQLKKGSPKTLLDEVDYMSSVSGGSLASAYYCLRRFDGKEKDLVEFFKDYKEGMRMNFEARSLLRLLLGYWILDVLTYYDRGDLIASVWDSAFFDRATFTDLAEAERRGAPALIINGTCFSNGEKFVFSTIPDERFNRSQYFKQVTDLGFIGYSVSKGYKAFQTMGFQSVNSDIGPYRVSKAVAASASVPNLLGPVTLKVHKAKKQEGLVLCADGQFLNISDGGIYDNYGLESLMQIFTEYLDRNPGKKAKIIIVDGSGFFDVDAADKAGSFSVAYYAERSLSISWLRTKSYMEYVFGKARSYKNKAGQRPYRNLEFNLVSLYGLLPSQKKTNYLVNTKERALKKFLRPDVTAAQFFEEITTIQTRFKITDKDAEVIEDVASKTIDRLRIENK
jgi:predicted acylesterase/phospholipase RssA